MSRRALILAAAGAALATGAAGAAPLQVTLTARPAIVAWGGGGLTLAGDITGGAGETVRIEARECGIDGWRLVALATTGPGGAWSEQTGLLKNTTFRARWKDFTSGEAAVRTRPGMILRRRSAVGWEVTALALSLIHI